MELLDRTKITSLRIQKGWDQKALASKAQVDQAVISRLERGLQFDCKLSVALAIAEALEVSIDDILSVETRHSPTNFTPQMKSALTSLGKFPPNVQNRLASVIEAYLRVLQHEGTE